MRIYSLPVALPLLWIFCSPAALLQGQDRRSVTEPTYPQVCGVYSAPLKTTPNGPGVDNTLEAQDREAKIETQMLRTLLSSKKCAKGQAVELATGDGGTYSAFLINPITLTDVSLIIDGGATVYGSRNPARYQVPPHDPDSSTCGMIGPWPINSGCKPLFTLSSHTGIYGNGVIDGQGDKLLLSGVNGIDGNKATWWDLTTSKKESFHDGTCRQPHSHSSDTSDEANPDTSADSNSGSNTCEQQSPLVISSADVADLSGLILYKTTIRNPPYHTTKLVGDAITVWSVKVQAPWNLPNTDGFDVRGKDITFFDDTVANGDQEIAITSNGASTSYMTIENFHGYSKGGITILGNGESTSSILVENAEFTGDLPSVVSTIVNGKAETFVNGVSFSQMQQAPFKLTSWGEALPNGTGDIKALQISNQSSNDVAGSQISDVTFHSVCISDIIKPIDISLANSSPVGFAHGIKFQDVHVLKPTTLQFPSMTLGQVNNDPPKPGQYELFFDAPLDQNGKPASTNEITFDNLVFDAISETQSSILKISAYGNDFTANTNAYPPVLYELARTTPVDGFHLSLGYNKYVGTIGGSDPYLANACHSMPFITGDLSLSTNQRNAALKAGMPITLDAVVQPIMSQTTLFIRNSYRASPGLLAIASPALTNAVEFYDNWTLIGSARLSANGTLARFTIPHITAGVHNFRAVYPADRYYREVPFGLVTVKVQP